MCRRLCAAIGAVVVSVNYRLAPEHRWPAAYDDGVDALRFIDTTGVPGLGAEVPVDLASCFLAGESAGGNIVHHVANRWAARWPASAKRVRVAGIFPVQPYFGGVERTAAESDPPDGVSLTVETADQFWRTALPAGATRDHPVANPFGPDSPDLEAVALPPVLVEAPEGDVLRDRVLLYAARLKEMGKAVELAEFKGSSTASPSCGGARPTRS